MVVGEFSWGVLWFGVWCVLGYAKAPTRGQGLCVGGCVGGDLAWWLVLYFFDDVSESHRVGELWDVHA